MTAGVTMRVPEAYEPKLASTVIEPWKLGRGEEKLHYTYNRVPTYLLTEKMIFKIKNPHNITHTC